MTRPHEDPDPTRGEPARVAESMPDVCFWPRTGKAMVRIPAGPFLFGERLEPRELPEFWIDRAPVTCAEYARFLADVPAHPVPYEAQAWARPYGWDPETRTHPPGMADHPVALIAWYDAVDYAEWAGLRIPTEEEWEKAARGTDGRRYPWGAWDHDRCNTEEAGIGATTPIGAYAPHGDSPYGCVDMAGNVWEWTLRARAAGPAAALLNPAEWVLRGGSFINDRLHARTTARDWDLPDSGIRLHGLRLVR